ncbi:putative mediator of RNA polymerase II transcription subunit 26 isoform X2 [Drosophila montana]|uniref:putative mediator of RNA polymerase II transcription subunit 26 isoform X2 n=1 Tax=Drosophila montana TaxID=40370 RepID=UPI00313BF8EA
MRRRDILRMWAQIVQQTGIEKYTAEEWQENYEEFWKCMQSPTDPYIRIESIDHLLNDPAFVNQQQQPPKSTSAKRKSKPKAEHALVHNYDETEPLALWRKRIKSETNILLSKESKATKAKTQTRKTVATAASKDRIPKGKETDEQMLSRNALAPKLTNNHLRKSAIDVQANVVGEKFGINRGRPSLFQDASLECQPGKEQVQAEELAKLHEKREQHQNQHEETGIEIEQLEAQEEEIDVENVEQEAQQDQRQQEIEQPKAQDRLILKIKKQKIQHELLYELEQEIGQQNLPNQQKNKLILRFKKQKIYHINGLEQQVEQQKQEKIMLHTNQEKQLVHVYEDMEQQETLLEELELPESEIWEQEIQQDPLSEPDHEFQEQKQRNIKQNLPKEQWEEDNGQHEAPQVQQIQQMIQIKKKKVYQQLMDELEEEIGNQKAQQEQLQQENEKLPNPLKQNGKQKDQKELLDQLDQESEQQKPQQDQLMLEIRRQKVHQELLTELEQEIEKQKAEKEQLEQRIQKQQLQKEQLNIAEQEENRRRQRTDQEEHQTDSELDIVSSQPKKSNKNGSPAMQNKLANQSNRKQAKNASPEQVAELEQESTPRRIRTRLQCSNQANQEQQRQQQLNAIRRCSRSKRQSNAMNAQIAHISQKAIDLTPTSDSPNSAADTNSQSNEPENLCLPKGGNQLEAVPETQDEHKLNLSQTKDFSKESLAKPLENDSKAECELEDMLINEAMQLSAPLAAPTDLGQLLADDGKCGVAEIDRCLQIFNDKTPSEIDHQIADTSDFFDNLPNLSTIVEKTPLEMDTAMNNVLNYDDDDDDDDDNDAISVTTSWDGEDEPFGYTNSAKQPTENTKVALEEKDAAQPARAEESLKAVAQVDSTVSSAKTRLSELVNFRIPKKANRQPERQQGKQPPDLILRSQQQQQHRRPQPVKQRPILPAARGSQRSAAETTVNSGPIFAPPFRLPPEPDSALSGIPNIYTNECKYFIFGIKCWRFLDGQCDQINCQHTLSGPWEVQRRLQSMKLDQLCDTYSMVLRHGLLFRNFFVVFAEIFGNRGMRWHLLRMVQDCSLYMAYCAPFITDIYYLLLRYDLAPPFAAAQFMKHLWRPNIGHAYPDLTMQLLRILAAADWFNYIPNLNHLFYNQSFPIPVEFMACLAHDAVGKDDPVLVKKCWELVLFSPIDRNDEALSSVIKILQNWSETAGKLQAHAGQPAMREQLLPRQQQLPHRYVSLPQAEKMAYNLTNPFRHTFEDNIDLSDF